MRLLLILCAGPFLIAALSATDPIADEDLRVRVLSSIFPGMEVERLPRTSSDSSLRFPDRWPMTFPDAMAADPRYRVTGAAMNALERCAGENILDRSIMDSREARLQLVAWPRSAGKELLGVLQYRFEGARPSASCTSIATLLRLEPNGKTWRVAEQFPLEAARHHHMEGIQLVSLSGAGYDELVIESDSGDGNQFLSTLRIFNLSRGRFQELLHVPSRFRDNLKTEQWTQTLDIARTRENPAGEFCFVKTVYANAHRRLATPLVTQPCYAAGEGVTAMR